MRRCGREDLKEHMWIRRCGREDLKVKMWKRKKQGDVVEKDIRAVVLCTKVPELNTVSVCR